MVPVVIDQGEEGLHGVECHDPDAVRLQIPLNVPGDVMDAADVIVDQTDIHAGSGLFLQNGIDGVPEFSSRYNEILQKDEVFRMFQVFQHIPEHGIPHRIVAGGGVIPGRESGPAVEIPDCAPAPPVPDPGDVGLLFQFLPAADIRIADSPAQGPGTAAHAEKQEQHDPHFREDGHAQDHADLVFRIGGAPDNVQGKQHRHGPKSHVDPSGIGCEPVDDEAEVHNLGQEQHHDDGEAIEYGCENL